jgi:hypothetical protein
MVAITKTMIERIPETAAPWLPSSRLRVYRPIRKFSRKPESEYFRSHHQDTGSRTFKLGTAFKMELHNITQ